MADVEDGIYRSVSTDPETVRRRRRIILRLRVNEFNGPSRIWAHHQEALQAYFKWAELEEFERQEGKNNFWTVVQPIQDADVGQRSFHVIVDIHYGSPGDPSVKSIPHELYAVRREPDGELRVHPYRNPLIAQNTLSKIRQFSDELYPYAGWRNKEYLDMVGREAALEREFAPVREAARARETALERGGVLEREAASTLQT
ncbi:hypothetical protein ACLMJK_005665 [Lecanora helva]